MPPAESRAENAPVKSRPESASSRVAIIDKVRTSLNFFVLALLVVEFTLGGLAAKGPYPLTALYGMFFFLAVLISLVFWLTAFKREALLGIETSQSAVKLSKFCDGLCGYWWENIQQAGPMALSVVELSRDSSTDTVKLQGRVYSGNGELLATWDSLAACISLEDRKVFYYWTGQIFERPGTQEGFGQIHFYESLNDADGSYSDANLADLKTAAKRNVRFKRSSRDEEKILSSREDARIADLIKQKLN